MKDTRTAIDQYVDSEEYEQERDKREHDDAIKAFQEQNLAWARIRELPRKDNVYSAMMRRFYGPPPDPRPGL